MKGKVPPRIYCIPATKAPIVAVFRRGPTSWSHVGLWDLGARRYEPGDAWDQHRNARIQKFQPGGDRLLCVESRGWAGGEFGTDQEVDGLRVGYWLEREGRMELLDQLQWADWDRDGSLLVATRSGKLQVWAFNGDRSEVLFDEDLSLSEPSPASAPGWALQW